MTCFGKFISVRQMFKNSPTQFNREKNFNILLTGENKSQPLATSVIKKHSSKFVFFDKWFAHYHICMQNSGRSGRMPLTFCSDHKKIIFS